MVKLSPPVKYEDWVQTLDAAKKRVVWWSACNSLAGEAKTEVPWGCPVNQSMLIVSFGPEKGLISEKVGGLLRLIPDVVLWFQMCAHTCARPSTHMHLHTLDHVVAHRCKHLHAFKK